METDEISIYLVTGYNGFVATNRDSKRGGVMLQCNKFCNITTESKIDFQEALCVDICKKNQTFKTIVVCKPPRSYKVEFVNMMDKLLENLSSSNRSVNICGDMNLDIMKNNLLSRNYLNSIAANGFCISSPEPTRSTNKYSSCLDHFINQNLGKYVSVEVLEHQNFTDHNPVILTWRTSEDINKNDLILRDTSFVKNQDAVSRYKMALEANLNKNSGIIYKSVDPCNAFSTFN